ncbi:HXXEE domain-containing protein [Streptomyces nitrosporeus]|uniref:HXXEE domain-containing protein n=1 Tax=Streptomyces nitrosporeus TaxID=28894 RepID=UPI00167C759B|nr:HXXEE domain-containing protein [Streptomyces nitrosporeus]GGY91670.1 membrane protein [Streptomyces nitrosporeus]
MDQRKVSGAVTWGLFAAWAVHDLEELATMARWAADARPRLQERFPRVPGRVWERLDLRQREAATAIGLMGGVVAAASAAGARSGGHSPFFGTAVAGFGLHGAVHLAQSAAYRGYTPGAVTAALVVLPYSVRVVRRLSAAGVPPVTGRSAAVGLALFPVAAVGVHGIARRLNRRRHGPAVREGAGNRAAVPRT